MTEQKLDEVLKEVYHKDGTVPQGWNERLREKWEKQQGMSGRKTPWYRHGVAVAALIICIVGVPASVYAYFHYMTPAQTAQEMGMNKLAVKFGQQKDQEQSVFMKGYRISYLGMVTGKNLAEGLEGAEVDEEKTYIVTAIQKENGEAMTYEDRFFVGPLIRGLEPIHFNIAGRGSSAVRSINNGIQYCISECDTIGIFAKRDIYLAVQEGDFLSAEAYTMNKETGVITANKDYGKVNALFQIKLDPGMADEEKASAYIAEIKKELEEPTDDGKEEESEPKEADGSDLEFPSDYVVKYGDVTVKLRKFGGTRIANYIELNAFDFGENGTLDIDFRPSVQGEGIQEVTFDAEGGKFYEVENIPEKKAESLEEKAFETRQSIDKMTKYTRIYDEFWDDADDALWYGTLKGKGTTTIRVPGKGNEAAVHYALRVERKLKDESAKKDQKKLVEELEKLKIRMKIKKEDGTVIEKLITCHVTQYYFDPKTKDKKILCNHYYYEYEIQ